jgi:gamma-glutamyltranspeptidase/glutathione hydrolase
LELIAKQGYQAFYRGEIAQKIADFSKSQKGYLNKRDLMYYEVKWRKPVEGHFDGYKIVSMPPPSSGGIHVIQFLNFLENDHLSQKGFLSAVSIHLAAASLQSAFADRAHYLGDPDFVKVPEKELLSLAYAKMRRAEVSMDHARHADEVTFGKLPKESNETTHISIMDDKGNAVSTTQTVNGWMGAAVVAPGTGILLNNEMDDFAAQVNATNLYGAVGGEPNLIAPGKTPLSSMSPTILLKDKKPILSLGAPGGTRIISCVAQTILNYVEFKLPLYESVADIRYHHQWKPDILTIDPPGPSRDVLEKLKSMGYNVQLEPVPCNVMAVSREGGDLHAVADPRDIGTSLAR